VSHKPVATVAWVLILIGGIGLVAQAAQDRGTPAPAAFTPPPPPQAGVVANQGGTIAIIDARNFVTYGPYLSDQLGTWPDRLGDVALTKNGQTALVGNIDNHRVYFVKTTPATAPTVLGSVQLSFSPSDIAIAPNQRFAVVAGPGQGNLLAVLDLRTRTLVNEFAFPGHDLQVAAVSGDSQTVITVDAGSRVGVLRMNPVTGALEWMSEIDLSVIDPANVVTAPNGRLFIVTAFDVTTHAGAVLRVLGPGNVVLGSWVPKPSATVDEITAAVFRKDGLRCYLVANHPVAVPGLDPIPQSVLTYSVAPDGTFAEDGVTVTLHDPAAPYPSLGFDHAAIDPTGRFLFVSTDTETAADGPNRVRVVDLVQGRQILALTPGLPGGGPPTGIAFR
jgi:DNA-binding beta-propeller fold protein YncE